jgi:hypothetical protein
VQGFKNQGFQIENLAEDMLVGFFYENVWIIEYFFKFIASSIGGFLAI